MSSKTKITSEPFGELDDGTKVTKFTLTNSHAVSVSVIDWGAAISNVLLPDRQGDMADVILGFDTMAEYQAKSTYFGAVCGRTSNRIAGATFDLDGETYKLAVNNGPNCNHGGVMGFDKRMWKGEVSGDKLKMTYISADGEEGYPGELTVSVTYSLTEDSCLNLDYSATCTKATPLNVTSHGFYNLGGHGQGHINDHVVTIYADKYLPLDEHNVPLGPITSVQDSPYDLQSATLLGDRFPHVPGQRGFDNNWCLGNEGRMVRAARVEHPPSGRSMECHTTEPGLQLYTAYYLDGMTGKQGATYPQLGAFCLEAQHFPDSIHRPEYPNTVLRPGETYRQTTFYKFGLMTS